MNTQKRLRFFAVELRLWYQRYFTIGMLFSITLHLLIIGLYFLVKKLSEEETEPPMVRILKYSELGPPPSLQENAPQPVAVAASAALPTIAIPIPVPDEEAPAEQTIATQTEMSQQVSTSDIGSGTGDSIVVNPGDIGAIRGDFQIDEDPDIDAYIPVEKNPEPVKMVQPQYPDLAIRAGLEGTVYVKVLVNKEGKVDKAVMVKNDGMTVFDEPAISAAKQWVFTPAIMNGHPVKVWVMVPLRFRLR